MSRTLAASITKALADNGFKHTAVYCPADDDSMDDEIEIQLLGVPTNIAVQLGPYGSGLNEYSYKNGELDGVTPLAMWNDCRPLPIIRGVIAEMQKRAKVSA